MTLKSDYCTQQDLLMERGWSMRMVKTLLGEPHHRAPNQHCGSSVYDVKLFSLLLVRRTEGTPQFAEMLASKQARAARRMRRPKTGESTRLGV